jgi:protein-tyrosine phosphatase
VRILFVCLGNICRSPAAEGCFRARVEAAGLADRITIDSAGTGDWHVGQPPDRRMREAARRRGLQLDGRARQVTRADFERFDRVIAMDRDNERDLLALAPASARHKVGRLRRWDAPDAEPDVPDPYYGGPEGFDAVLDIVDRCAVALLAELRAELGA